MKYNSGALIHMTERFQNIPLCTNRFARCLRVRRQSLNRLFLERNERRECHRARLGIGLLIFRDLVFQFARCEIAPGRVERIHFVLPFALNTA